MFAWYDRPRAITLPQAAGAARRSSEANIPPNEIDFTLFDDEDHSAGFAYAGEIRFGPLYYSLTLEGRPLAGRTFSGRALWMRNRILVAEEWASTKESNGPRARLVAFDVRRGCQCVLVVAECGMVPPQGATADYVLYGQELPRAAGDPDHVPRRRKTRRCRLPADDRWERIPGWNGARARREK